MKKLKWILFNIDAVLACAGLTLTIAITSVNVFARYIFGKSFASAEELAYLGFAYTFCLGISFLFKNRAMIAIEFVVNKFPEKVQRIVELVDYVILAGTCVFLTYQSVQLSIIGWDRYTSALRMRYTFVDLAAVMAFGLMTIYCIKFIIDIIKHRELIEPSLEEQY